MGLGLVERLGGGGWGVGALTASAKLLREVFVSALSSLIFLSRVARATVSGRAVGWGSWEGGGVVQSGLDGSKFSKNSIGSCGLAGEEFPERVHTFVKEDVVHI